MANRLKRTSSAAVARTRGLGHMFLVFGIPKSGTTFLQRMLNMHPEVSCPSEQSFDLLTSDLAALLDRYEAGLRTVDRRTGGQGIPAFDGELRNNVLSALIGALAKSYAKGKPIYGLNENSVIERIEYYDNILDHPKMIAIFRDPVDTAASMWRHNHRLAKQEPNLAGRHLARLGNPAGTLDGLVLSFADNYKALANQYLLYAADRRNFLTLTYEALVQDNENQLKRLFQFLGADAAAATIARIAAASSRQAMASASPDPWFFGVGRADADEPRVSDAVRRQVGDSLAPELARLGYRLGADQRQHLLRPSPLRRAN
jgi:hypothetical protein